jgi:hypothetical protein
MYLNHNHHTTPQPQNQKSAVNTANKSNQPITSSSLNPSHKKESQSPEISSSLEDKSFNSTVNGKGLDYSFETTGKIIESSKTIILTYNRNWECSPGSSVDMTRQEWRITFNLPSKKWTNEVKESSNCAYLASQEWISQSTEPSQFSLEIVDGETILRADSQDTDGSIIIKDRFIVKYKKK